MIAPPVWTAEQLQTDLELSIAAFSTERLEEPLEDYLEAFDQYQSDVETLLETSVDLSDLSDTMALLGEPDSLMAFRYLAAPPISYDDLKVLVEARALSKAQLLANADLGPRIVSTVRQVIDRRRFPWVADNREPTETERNAAIVASAALMAASRAQTNRRTVGKEKQEARVKEVLRSVGFTEVPSRRIPNFASAPDLGEYCPESLLGTRKADVVARLWDQRVMAIECKVSNSSTNSVKRLNNDAAVKAERWRNEFGSLQVVPTAILSGVFKLGNLKAAQANGLTLFWAHDLDPMLEWIESTRP